MATTVYTQEQIALQDDKEVTLRPLAIGRLRRFMASWEKFKEAETEDETLNVFINCSGIALEADFKGQFDSLRASKDEAEEGEVLSAEYKAYLEEVLDMETIYKIMEVCGGMKLNDPELLAALAATAEAGTN